MKKTYSTPQVTTSDVVQSTHTGPRYAWKEFITLVQMFPPE